MLPTAGNAEQTVPAAPPQLVIRMGRRRKIAKPSGALNIARGVIFRNVQALDTIQWAVKGVERYLEATRRRPVQALLPPSQPSASKQAERCQRLIVGDDSRSRGNDYRAAAFAQCPTCAHGGERAKAL